MDTLLNHYHPWAQADDLLIKELGRRKTSGELAVILGRTAKAIEHRRQFLKVRPGRIIKAKIGRKSPIRIPESAIVLSYIAGLIDGEGHIGIGCSRPRKKTHYPHYRSVLHVQGADQRMIKYLYQNCGGYMRTELRKTKRNKTVYRWYTDGQDAVNLLVAIRPYLVCKQDQVDVLIKFRESCVRAYNRLPASVIALRHSCYQELRNIHADLSNRGLQFADRLLPEPPEETYR